MTDRINFNSVLEIGRIWAEPQLTDCIFLKLSGNLSGTRSGTHGKEPNAEMSFIADLKRIRDEMRTQSAQQADPWRIRLERARGKVGDDGVERVSTQSLWDFLDVPQRSRNAGAARRLAKIMRELGWSPTKARGMTPGGFTDQVRGYARSKTDAVMR